MTPEQMTADLFDPESYKPSYIVPGSLAEAGKPVYKIIPSEEWRLVFPLTEEQQKEYEGSSSLRIFFKNDDLTIPGDYTTVTGADGAVYGASGVSGGWHVYSSEYDLNTPLGQGATLAFLASYLRTLK